jgi:hypothetical protein
LPSPRKSSSPLALAATSLAFVADASARYVSVPSTAPARIIEVRPGLWVGSYQCITDLERGRDCS